MFLNTQVYQDMIYNGQTPGDVAGQMAECRFDSGLLRPFVGDDGHQYVTINTGQSKYDETRKDYVPVYKAERVSDLLANGINVPTANATLALRKDQWLQMDQAVLRAARQRLRAWGDLAARNTFGGFNGMSKMILEHETMSDPGQAKVDMDALTEGYTDAPRFQLQGLPLPITHGDFFFSSRRLAVSRSGGGTPLDTTMAEATGRRVAEAIEKTVIGVQTGITFGNAADYGNPPTVFGYTNHPQRATKTDMTAPTSSNGTTVVDEILALRDLLYANNFFGPFVLYTSTNYDKFIDNDFKTNSDKTTRQRIMEIDQIEAVRRLDFLTGDVVILVQMTADVARAVNGMDITTIQWESNGGMRLNFKVMAIQVPQIRADFNGNCGVAVGTTS